jgi:hypothetical protein
MAWLKDRLASGPAKAGDVINDAKANGIGRMDLYNAAKAVGVLKDPPAGGHGCSWLLPGHQVEPVPVEPEEQRRCRKCGQDRPLRTFSRNSRGAARAHICRTCENARKRATERAAADPESVPSINRAVDAAPDRRPAVRLRTELERQREMGRLWRHAWPAAMRAALYGLPPVEQASWRKVFMATREHWSASYSRAPWPSNRRPALTVLDPEDRVAA